MQDKLPQPVLILFAKSPICGRVKTRLMPELSARQAAQVAVAMIEVTARQAARCWPGPRCIYTWPEDHHPLFTSLARTHQFTVSIQSDGDLGDKMLNALRGYTDNGQPAAILGCDVPHLPGRELSRAYHILQQGGNLIGPSHDGGYYLIGLQRTHPGLFQGINWGGGEVMQQTLIAANRCGADLQLLTILTDIDTYEDLVLAAKIVPELQKWL